MLPWHAESAGCASAAHGSPRVGLPERGLGQLAAELLHAAAVQIGELYATLYHNLGIDVNQTTIPDLNGNGLADPEAVQAARDAAADGVPPAAAAHSRRRAR